MTTRQQRRTQILNALRALNWARARIVPIPNTIAELERALDRADAANGYRRPGTNAKVIEPGRQGTRDIENRDPETGMFTPKDRPF